MQGPQNRDTRSGGAKTRPTNLSEESLTVRNGRVFCRNCHALTIRYECNIAKL